ncbi:MAG TPA: HEAT repeat domain-containing protein, partial [Methanomassiliicoccaceae archaeon]|nr:HEAT repeat domain-containing protein [Methanomassiliicoccaceae archaeon]
FWPFDLLNALTKDKDAEVRENAAWTLGELASMRVGVQSSVGYLTELLLDRDAMVRGTSSWALEQFAHHLHMSSPLAVERLEKLTCDRSPYVSKSAASALEIMKN